MATTVTTPSKTMLVKRRDPWFCGSCGTMVEIAKKRAAITCPNAHCENYGYWFYLPPAVVEVVEMPNGS